MVTPVRPFTCVCAHVSVEVGGAVEGAAADGAQVGFFTCVFPEVVPQLWPRDKGCITLRARVWPLPCTHTHTHKHGYKGKSKDWNFISSRGMVISRHEIETGTLCPAHSYGNLQTHT